ncbi:Ig-like domain-containing protein [Aeromicrobium wangtongii]|uniref:Ig-like domain-containing protein n=1 Tax=Aeromicrobium wangtongii TaxID=2969247 RepID=A0ABY5M670_9ACTN|nr:Ig-like domain-containing protein [Aeromicrobium wangtongii]MCD9199020.1 Ig-like domain-containing protein [Aeromicrobium wangtongii]UUP12947.1 Ig-like domain-containing protein [Aeromicrobium wangtongii]
MMLSRRVLASFVAALLVAAVPVVTAPAATAVADPAPTYYPSGPQKNVPVSTVTGGGWKQCYSSTFDTPFGEAAEKILDPCDGPYILLAGRATGSDTLLLAAAAPRAEAIAPQVGGGAQTHLVNGSEWYYKTAWSWGFAPAGAPVQLGTCDMLTGDERLCLHTLAGLGGYRIGDITALNYSSDYEVVAYEPVVKTDQTVTITSTRPDPAAIGSSYTVTATGGGSGEPVTFSLAPGSADVCSIKGAIVTFDHAGACTVLADQAGTALFNAAPTAQETITVAKTAQTVAFDSTPSAAVVGATYTPTVATSAGGQPVALGVEGAACSLAAGVVSFDHAGLCTVVADRAGSRDHAAATQARQEIVVGQAATTTTLTVEPDRLVAKIAVTAPGAGLPAGTVDFMVGGTSVGTASVAAGEAVLSYAVPAGQSRLVAASYSGAADFAGSSTSLTRNDPAITASLSSAAPRAASGWYRTPVTVTFTCTPNGAPLVSACPSPVTVGAEGVAPALARTVSSTDGGVASVSVDGIAIDRSTPRVKVSKVKAGRSYAGQAPAARCSASDSLSGVQSCKVSRRTTGDRTTVTAIAKDRAGNTARTSVSYTTRRVYIDGARFSNGVYTVTAGRSYRLVVAGRSARPVYYDAEVSPRKPFKRDHAFKKAGKNRWALSVTMQNGMQRQRQWNLGVKIGSTMKVLKVRVK